MEALAIKRYIRSSPRKMRLVVDLIRGRKVSEALTLLKFNPKLASEDVYCTLNSAVGNMKYKLDALGERYSEENFVVKEVQVNQGPTMKRISPAPMGRAYRIRKRSNHLTIVLETK
ncbi:MAG: 50S ribosomal protein L22 [Candidatus Kapaibacteriota bacterium]|jgi:large subunit ribosomal protein L22